MNIMIFNKKAQSALEFLTTYGWAFLVALLAIAALNYLGVLSPSKFLPERCTFSNQLSCTDYLIDATNGQVIVQVENGFGEPIKINSLALINPATDAALANCDQMGTGNLPDIVLAGGAFLDIDETGAPDNGLVIPNGKKANIRFQCATNDLVDIMGLASGNKGKVGVDVSYYFADSSGAFSHTISGDIFAEAI